LLQRFFESALIAQQGSSTPGLFSFDESGQLRKSPIRPSANTAQQVTATDVLTWPVRNLINCAYAPQESASDSPLIGESPPNKNAARQRNIRLFVS